MLKILIKRVLPLDD